MSQYERQHLVAEISSLEEILAGLSPKKILERKSFEYRLKEARERLAAQPPSKEPARARLTFSGPPVVGSHGIFADFGIKIMGKFNDAVASMTAALAGPLSSSGPLPNREANQLLITNTALGSFGFELEEHIPVSTDLQQTLGLPETQEPSPLAQALENTQNLLLGCMGTDDELADAAAETDPRALKEVREFLETLANHKAICTLNYGQRAVRFRDADQVRQCAARLGSDSLHEEEITLKGQFTGFVLSRRIFDFRIEQSSEEICGKAKKSLAALPEINRHLFQDVSIKVLKTQVGSGKARYTVIETPSWGTPSTSET